MVDRESNCSVDVEKTLSPVVSSSRCLDGDASLLPTPRSKVTVFLASIPAAAIRAATPSASAAMATGTARPAGTRRPAPRAQTGSFPVRAAPECATRPRSAATTRRGVPMGRMRRTATTANPETSTVGPTCVSLRRGGVTARRTA